MNKSKNKSKREEEGWVELTEKSLNKIWKNEKDEKNWSRFGSQPKMKKFKESDRAKFHIV